MFSDRSYLALHEWAAISSFSSKPETSGRPKAFFSKAWMRSLQDYRVILYQILKDKGTDYGPF